MAADTIRKQLEPWLAEHHDLHDLDEFHATPLKGELTGWWYIATDAHRNGEKHRVSLTARLSQKGILLVQPNVTVRAANWDPFANL